MGPKATPGLIGEAMLANINSESSSSLRNSLKNNNTAIIFRYHPAALNKICGQSLPVNSQAVLQASSLNESPQLRKTSDHKSFHKVFAHCRQRNIIS